MKNPKIDKKFNHIVQAIPMLVFLLFTIFFFVNGNVGFCRLCKGLESLGTELFLKALIASTIIIYSFIYLLSLFWYSPKFNYLSIFFLFLFFIGTSKMESQRKVRKRLTEIYQDKIESLDYRINYQPNNYNLRESKSNYLAKLGSLTKDCSLYLTAIQELENFQRLNPNHLEVYKDISKIYRNLAEHTKNHEYYLSAIEVLKEGNDIHPESDSTPNTCGNIYEKINKLTGDTKYLYLAIKEYESIESYHTLSLVSKYSKIGEIYTKLENYPKAFEAYNNALSKNKNNGYIRNKVKKLKTKV